MMKTGDDAANDVMGLISTMSTLIDGNIYKYHKPLNSKKVNIIVVPIVVSNAPLQEGVVNVNIHAPNLPPVSIDGITDANFPNSALLANLAKTAIGLLDCQWEGSFHTDIDTTPVLLQDNDGTWYTNIRVNYYSSISEFKNI